MIKCLSLLSASPHTTSALRKGPRLSGGETLNNALLSEAFLRLQTTCTISAETTCTISAETTCTISAETVRAVCAVRRSAAVCTTLYGAVCRCTTLFALLHSLSRAKNPPHQNLSGVASAVFALLFAVSFTNHDYNHQLKVFAQLEGPVRHRVLGAKFLGNVRAA